MTTSRRDLILQSLFGMGMVGLRSLATGIPVAMLSNPRRAFAEGEMECVSKTPQFLVLSISGAGDSTGNNAPGSYIDSRLSHPPQPFMADTQISLAGSAYTAAAPWALLPQEVLDRTCFFHHATKTPVHGDMPAVLALRGRTLYNEQLPSLFGAHLGSCLGAVQKEPMSLGGDAVSFGGRDQPLLAPRALSAVLASPNTPLNNLTAIRDKMLNDMHAYLRTNGNAAQKRFIDQYVVSQQQVRSLSHDLVNGLAAITGNGGDSQLAAALLLFRMKITPAVIIHLGFGADNHGDPDLRDEANQTQQSLKDMAKFFADLKAAKMQDQVTFGILNVFGRTMGPGGAQGRVHNGDHNCMVLIGKGVRGGVVGGIAPIGDDFGATPIDSATGRSSPAGDISVNDSLASAGATLGAALGVSSEFIATSIKGGKIVKSAVAV
jgi:hypothetical protein